jgi:hypothetical protein
MSVAKKTAFFVHQAKQHRVAAGLRIKVLENESRLSKATIHRIEGGSPVAETTANAYRIALTRLVPSYPHSRVYSFPENGKPQEVRIKPDHHPEEFQSDLPTKLN